MFFMSVKKWRSGLKITNIKNITRLYTFLYTFYLEVKNKRYKGGYSRFNSIIL